MKTLIVAMLMVSTAGIAQTHAPRSAPVERLQLWRLDCGTILMKDYGQFFSDTFAYPANAAKELTVSCYLIKNGDRFFLWDTGIDAHIAEKPEDNPIQRVRLGSSIADQLKRIGIKPESVQQFGISHYHGDHTGQASSFEHAEMLIGAADLSALKVSSELFGVDPSHLRHWTKGDGQVQQVTGDHDVFGDGKVTMLSLPGHTPGHHALLVRLASGPVLLSGDVYHFQEQVPIKGVPPFNWNRADSLAAMDRFDRIARNLGAKVIIQHEPADIAKLPAFPAAAE